MSHGKLWTTMKDMGYLLHRIHPLAELYRKQNVKVKAVGTLSEKFQIQKGVRQGYVMSPYLSNIMAEMVMRETLDDFMSGIQIGGQEITNLRYADKIVLTAKSVNQLQELVTTLDTEQKQVWLSHQHRQDYSNGHRWNAMLHHNTKLAARTNQHILISWFYYRSRCYKQRRHKKQTS